MTTQVTTTEKTVETKNLSWARLTTNSVEAAQHWLIVITNVWVAASHDGEEKSEKEVEDLLEIIRNLEEYPRTEAEASLEALRQKFSSLKRALTKGENNPTRINCVLTKETLGHKLTVSWKGAFTAGRYLKVEWYPESSPKLRVEWDTGTGKESEFLGLPLDAEVYLTNYGDGYTKILPLKNHYREACQRLGADVSEIPETGIQGVEDAKRLLDEYVRQVTEEERVKAFHEGYANPW